MGITERKIRQKEEVRSSILHASWKIVEKEGWQALSIRKIVEKEGWQALSIRKIAEAIEYSAPVIYDHFANKEAILHEFTRQGFQRLNKELSIAKKKFSSPEEQLVAIADAYWEFAFSNKEYYQLMYGLGMPTCETVRQIAEVNSFTEIVSDSINNLIATSKNSTADPFLKLHTYWSLLHGLISINMMGNENGRNKLNAMVLKDFITGFISGIKG